MAEWACVLGRALIAASREGVGHAFLQSLDVVVPLCCVYNSPPCQAALWGQVSLWNFLLLLVP